MSKRSFRAWWKAAAFGAAFLLLIGCGGDDQVSAPSSKTEEPAPGPTLGSPVGINYRAIDAGDMLRWNAPSGTDFADIAGYNVYVYQPDPLRQDAYVKYNTDLVPGGRLVMTDLLPGDTYFFKVRAVNADVEEGADSDVLSFEAVGPAPAGGGSGRGGLGHNDGPPIYDGGDGVQY
jgi:hypothetical protein